MSELILVVDDERDLVEPLAFHLRREGFEVETAFTGEGGLELARAHPDAALLILDVMLPDLSGSAVCRQLREDDATKALPIIMLTARDEEIDRVGGFEAGADDYVTKPFSVRELLLRVRAVVRRARVTVEPPSRDQVIGILRIDSERHRAWVREREVTLTALEFRLLSTLVERRGRVQGRDVLLRDVWGMSADVTTRTVDTHVRRLRRKLGDADAYIETLRGVGYRFRDDVEEA